MFTMNTQSDELTDFQKFLALAGVSVLMIIGVLIFAHFSRGSTGYSNNTSSCETRYDSSACPDPETDGVNTKWQENLPDATPYDNPDDCGGYSCAAINQDAQNDIKQSDQQVEADIQAHGQ